MPAACLKPYNAHDSRPLASMHACCIYADGGPFTLRALRHCIAVCVTLTPAVHLGCAVGMAKWSGQGAAEGFRYNGLHLRLEADAARWIGANGGLEATWDAYIAACEVRRAPSAAAPFSP